MMMNAGSLGEGVPATASGVWCDGVFELRYCKGGCTSLYSPVGTRVRDMVPGEESAEL